MTTIDNEMASCWYLAGTRYPTAVAVVDDELAFTYDELYRRAEQIRAGLQARGVQPGMAVGIILPRCAYFVAAMLGVWACGAYFVPLAADLPPQRRQLLLARAGVSVVLDPALLATLLQSGLPEAPFLANWQPAQIAYGIFTSGSTAEPKFVRIRMSSVAHYVTAAASRFQIEPGLAYAMVSPFFADLGYTGLFLSLASGGKLHIVNDETIRDGSAFAAFMQQHPVDFLKITPSHFLALASHHEHASVFPARMLVCGGEALPHEILALHRAQGATCRISNHYGPTETTIGALAWQLPETVAPGPIALGRMLGEMAGLVLDDAMQEVAPGVAGELYLSGPGLAIDVSTEKGSGPGALMAPGRDDLPALLYRTGDLVSQVDGLFTFLGRVDDQIKCNGFRVSPLQLEQQIAAHLHRKVTILPLTTSGAPQLIAVVEAAPDAALEQEVRESLRNFLTAAELPSVILLLPNLPLNANGKLDRAAIKELAMQAGNTSAPAEDAMSADEREVLAVVAAVLNRSSLDLGASFAENGGHSLIAIKMMALLKRKFSVKINPRDISAAESLLALVREIVRLRGPGASGAAAPGNDTRWYPATEFLDGSLPPSSAALVKSAIELNGVLDIDALRQAIAGTLASHEVFRLEFQSGPAGWQYRVGPAPRYVIEVTLLAEGEAAGAALERAVAQLDQQRIDMIEGPHLAWNLVQQGPQTWILLGKNPHVLMDTVTRAMMLEEIAQRYNLPGAEARLRATPLSGAYSKALQAYDAWQNSAEFEANLAFWRRYYSACPGSATRAAVSRLAQTTDQEGHVEYAFSADEMAHFNTACSYFDCSHFELYFALFQSGMATLAGMNDIACTTSSSVRQWVYDAVAGDFSNRLYVRSKFDPNALLIDRLRHAVDSFRLAHAHGRIQFPQVVQVLAQDEAEGLQGARETKFLMLYPAAAGMAMNGITLAPAKLGLPIDTTRFQFCVDSSADIHRVKADYTPDYPVELVQALWAYYRQSASQLSLQIAQRVGAEGLRVA